MKFSDRPRASGSLPIGAPPEAVWALITDLPRMGEWSPENRGGVWLDGPAPPAIGARFEGTNERGHRSWTTVATVIESLVNERFCFAVNDVDDPAAVWCFDITATTDGCTVTETALLGPGPSGLSAVIEKYPDSEEEIVAARVAELEAAIATTLHGIRDSLENRRSGG